MVDINIRELAKQLNLSISTISKALKDSHEISQHTKERVVKLARELNYTPNPYASSLRRKKSNTIAVVVPDVADSFFSLALKGIESVAQKKNYHALVYLTYESFQKEQAILNEFKSGRVDGILISVASESTDSDHIIALRNKNIPVVFFDRVFENMETAKITTNDFESSYKATKHLLQRGCKDIVFLSISKNLSINSQRMEGYIAALKDYTKKANPNIIECSQEADQNIKLLQKLIQSKKKPDGILASVEKLTSPVYLVCKQLNISIPKELKVISFSNLETAPILSPPLTTITQPAFDMGKTAATILFKALIKKQHNIKNELIVLPSKLIIRGSTV